MTPVSLALISAFAFTVGLVVVIWNMATFMGGCMDSVIKGFGGPGSKPMNPIKKMIIHVIGGAMLGGGTIGLVASLVWYIVLNVKS